MSIQANLRLVATVPLKTRDGASFNVTIRIDAETLARRLLPNALKSKTRKTKLGGGAVVIEARPNAADAR